MARKTIINNVEVNKFPIKVYLKSPNPYKNKVVCNGIVVSTDKKLTIASESVLIKLKPIEQWLIVEN